MARPHLMARPRVLTLGALAKFIRYLTALNLLTYLKVRA
jgi:hypothetical protein